MSGERLAKSRRWWCRYCGKVVRTVAPRVCCGVVMAPPDRAGQRPFALGPLLDAAATHGLSGPALRERIGWERRTWVRVERDGLTPWQADAAAVAIGLHPAMVWCEQWLTEALSPADRAELAFRSLRLELHGVA